MIMIKWPGDVTLVLDVHFSAKSAWGSFKIVGNMALLVTTNIHKHCRHSRGSRRVSISYKLISFQLYARGCRCDVFQKPTNPGPFLPFFFFLGGGVSLTNRIHSLDIKIWSKYYYFYYYYYHFITFKKKKHSAFKCLLKDDQKMQNSVMWSYLHYSLAGKVDIG